MQQITGSLKSYSITFISCNLNKYFELFLLKEADLYAKDVLNLIIGNEAEDNYELLTIEAQNVTNQEDLEVLFQYLNDKGELLTIENAGSKNIQIIR